MITVSDQPSSSNPIYLPPIEDDIDIPLGIELDLNDRLPGLKLDEPTVVLIDANNFYRRAISEGFLVDYHKLRAIFAARCKLEDFYVFSAVDETEPKAVEWVQDLQRAGITTITKPVRQYIDDQNKYVYKGNMDTEMTWVAARLPDHIKHVIIGSCDSDFLAVVEGLQSDEGRTASVMGISNHRRRGMSADLIRQADYFYDLWYIKEQVAIYG